MMVVTVVVVVVIRQWEADEKLSFEKVLAGKRAAMEQRAATAFGPQVEKLVTEAKALELNKREEAAAALTQVGSGRGREGRRGKECW